MPPVTLGLLFSHSVNRVGLKVYQSISPVHVSIFKPTSAEIKRENILYRGLC